MQSAKWENPRIHAAAGIGNILHFAFPFLMMAHPILFMKRRTFVKSSLAACLTGTLAVRQTSAVEAAPDAREYYELRTYTLKEGKQPLLHDYLSKAFIPALGRLGIGPVGVFTEKVDAGPA